MLKLTPSKAVHRWMRPSACRYGLCTTAARSLVHGRRGCSEVLEVEDVQANIVHLTFDWGDDFTAQELST
jgi:hypothetical protein